MNGPSSAPLENPSPKWIGSMIESLGLEGEAPRLQVG